MIARFAALPLIAILMVGMQSCAIQASTESFEGRIISSLVILYKGAKPTDETQLKSLISLKPGDEYSQEAIDADIRALYENGFVDDVCFFVEPDGLSVKVTAEISVRLPLGTPVNSDLSLR